MSAIFKIVPAALIKQLAQDFNGGLRSVELSLRHIQIVNKNDDLLAKRSTKVARSSLLNFAVNDFLNLIAVGLRRETNLNRAVDFLVKLLGKHILNVGCLARSCGSDKESRDFVMDAELLNETVSDNVNSGHNNLGRLRFFGESIDGFLVDRVHPVFPLVAIDMVTVIVNETSVHLGGQKLLVSREFLDSFETSIANLLEELIEWASIVSGNCYAERPNDGEEEARINDLVASLALKFGWVGEVGVIENFELRRPQTQESLN